MYWKQYFCKSYPVNYSDFYLAKSPKNYKKRYCREDSKNIFSIFERGKETNLSQLVSTEYFVWNGALIFNTAISKIPAFSTDFIWYHKYKCRRSYKIYETISKWLFLYHKNIIAFVNYNRRALGSIKEWS